MKFVKIFFLSIFLTLFTFSSKSQDSLTKVFSLDECIQYALKNNLELQQYTLFESRAELNSKNAKNQYLPVIEGGVKNNYNWGLFIDPSTNILTTQNTQIWSGGVGADWVLFNGGYTYYNIKQNKEFHTAAKADEEYKKNEITLNVTAAYYQLLYYHEQLKITELQRTQSAGYYLLIKKSVEAGILHKRELLRMETQLSMNDVLIVEAENAVLRYNLLLRQTMGFTDGKAIQIDSNITGTISELENWVPYDSLCINGGCFLPEIRKAKSVLEAKRFGLSAVSSLHYPVFFVSAGVQTKSSSLIVLPQREQFRRNMSEFVTFNLKVPIFNRFETLNSISLSKIDIMIEEKEVKKISLQADQKIQAAHLDLMMAHKKYWAFHKQLKLQESQFVLDEKSYLNGIINYTDYNYSLNLLNRSRIQLVQARYDYLYKREILAFYQRNTFGK